MSYLAKESMRELKNNINRILSLNDISVTELADVMNISVVELKVKLNPDSPIEITPEQYYDIHIFLMTKHIDDELLGKLPKSYGERLKYFVYKHSYTMDEFAERTKIPRGTLFNMSIDKITIGNTYRDKMCKILSEEEFNKLSPYLDISLDLKRDKAVIRSINFNYNIDSYSDFAAYSIIKEFNIENSCDKNKFLCGKYKFNKKQLAAIKDKYKDDPYKDNLNLSNPKNKFGYWFAYQLYAKNNSIALFAERCSLDKDYIASIISGQCLIDDKDIKNISMHLGVDIDGLYKICPKTENELIIIDGGNEMEERNNKKKKSENNLNSIVRNKIKDLGYEFKEFCQVMGINKGSFETALYLGKLPKKHKEMLIKELDLYDYFAEKEPEPITVPIDSIKTINEQLTEITPLEKLDERSIKEITEYDKINILEIFKDLDYDHQISLINLIYSVSIHTTKYREPDDYTKISRNDVIGFISRMSYLESLLTILQ